MPPALRASPKTCHQPPGASPSPLTAPSASSAGVSPRSRDPIVAAARPKKIPVAIDNTYAAGILFDAFAHGTETIARAIAASSAFSIAGGGDTLAAIAKYGIEKQVGYISTGGGAFLEVLEGKTLPAFEILTKRAAG